MKRKLSLIALMLLIISPLSISSSSYRLISDSSSLSFATIRGQYSVEAASIDLLSGILDANGEFALSFDLNSIHTGIPIQVSRIAGMFFNSGIFPEVLVTGRVDLSNISDIPKKIIIPARVSMYKSSKTILFQIIAEKINDYIVVSSSSPIIIRSQDFGIPRENLNMLAATVGGIGISDTVPVFFTLVFKKDH